MSKNKYEIDMCNGTIMDKLISFSVPLMLSGILQLMFNAVDIIVVGRFAGSQSLAAVGSTTALINMFVNLFIGVSLGANVLAARFYASGKHKEMSLLQSETDWRDSYRKIDRGGKTVRRHVLCQSSWCHQPSGRLP